MVATVVGNVLSYRRRARAVARWSSPSWPSCAIGGFVWFIATVQPRRHPGRHLDGRRAPGRAVRLGAVHPRLRRPGPAGRGLLPGRLGRPDGGGRRPVGRPGPRRLRGGLGGVRRLGARGHVAVDVGHAGRVPWLSLGWPAWRWLVLAVARWSPCCPAPTVSTALIFPSSSANSPPVDSPSNLTDGIGLPARPCRHPRGPDRRRRLPRLRQVRSTPAVRASLGNQVVMRVRANRPELLGRPDLSTPGTARAGWTSSPANGPACREARDRARPSTSPEPGPTGAGRRDRRRPDLLPGPVRAQPGLPRRQRPRVYIQSAHLFLTGDGTIVSATSMGAGTSTPWSPTVTTATAAAAARPPPPPADLARGTRSPRRQLAPLPATPPRLPPGGRRWPAPITAGIGAPGTPTPTPTTRSRPSSAGWPTHVRYTTDIPPLPAGADAVDSFLFGSRRGYCEQISTATVVMLRTLGIPARETVGYVPGPYNPITDLYDVQAKDAHAWVQVWFPGYGWQNFDPTADVPLANPSPGLGARHHGRPHPGPPPVDPRRRRAWSRPACRRWCVRRRLRRPATWAHQVAADLERGGGPARAGGAGSTRPCRPTAQRLAVADPGDAEGLPCDHPSWSSGTPTAASSRRPSRSPRPWPFTRPLPAARHGRRRRHRPPGSGPGHRQRLVERGPGGQQRPVGHQLAGPAEGQHGPEPVPPAGRGPRTCPRRPSPSTTTTSSSGPGSPITWILVWYWSDQKNGTGS